LRQRQTDKEVSHIRSTIGNKNEQLYIEIKR